MINENQKPEATNPDAQSGLSSASLLGISDINATKNETPNPDYKPKIVLPYTDEQLAEMEKCDCDEETWKWQKTVRRVKDEAYKAGWKACRKSWGVAGDA